MENKWVIYDKFGAERATVKELEYHGEWMGDEFITVTVKSPVPVEFKYGDYLVYRNSNEKYYIDYNPNKIHRATKESYGEAFVYENVKMYHESHVLKDVMFKDYVLNDNGMAYSQQAKFSFFAGSVEDLADRIQANLNKALGSNTWKVITPVWSRTHARNNITKAKWLGYYSTSAVSGITDVNISCDGISCKDALRLAYDQFALPYVIIGKNVIIGGDKGIDLSNTLEYGKGKGLFELEKNTDESQQVVTKMYAYGSSENMPLNYYANIGKTAKAAIACVSKREYIKDNPQLLLWVAKPWTEVKSAFGSNMSVTLQYRNLKVQANVRYDTYTFGKEKDDNDHALDHETEYLYFWMRQLDVEGALAFYEAVEQAGEPNNWPVTIAINSGANVNALPNDMVEHSTNYPALLSIQNLMMPGFPSMSLYDWVVKPVAEGGSGKGTAIDAGTGYASITFRSGQADEQTYTAYFSKEAKNPWIKSKNADTIGEREGAVYFDGSNTDVENIHPTIKGTGADVVLSNTAIADNGYLAEGADLSFDLYVVVVVDGDFDWGEAWANADEDIYVNMTSGYCVGRSFKMLAKPKKGGISWRLTLERAYDSSLQRYFPYQDTSQDYSTYAQIRPNDKFVVTGTQMSSSLVNAASEKLLEAALEALEDMDHPKETYIPKIDEIEAARERDTKSAGTSLYDTIHAGLRLKFKDTADGADSEHAVVVTQYIDTLTIKENGNNGIPTFDVVLRDEKELTLQQRIKNQMDAMSGGGTPSSSSSGKSTAEDEEKPVGGACLTPLLFELHKAEGNTDIIIDPEEWEGEIEADEEAREAAEEDGDDYETPLSIKSKYGHWTDYFLSALGIGSGGGGGGGTPLEWPLLQINAAGMSIDPSAGDTIVYDPNVTGHFKWGKAGGLSGLTLKDGDDTIIPTGTDESRTYDLGEKFLSLTYGGIVEGDIEIQGAKLTITSRPQNFTAGDNDVLTRKETEDYLAGKFVTVDFWNSLFETYNNTTKVPVNTKNPVFDNLKILVGTWTQQYISALGMGSGGSGGSGTPLNEPLMSINNINSNPTNQQIGYTLVWRGNNTWGFDKAGLDTTQMQTELATYSWWGRQFTASSKTIEGNMTNVGDIAFSASGKNIAGLLYFNTASQSAMQVKVGDNATLGTYHHPTQDNTNTITPKMYVDGYFGVKENVLAHAVELYKDNPYIDFHNGTTSSDYTTRIIEQEEKTSGNHDHYYLTIRTESGKTGLVVSNNANGVNGDYIRIGGATITWDNTNKALHIDKGVYSDSFVSSLGTGSSGGGGGIDLEAMWHSLTNAQPTDAYASTKINNNHLNLGTLKIQIGSEEDEWDPTVTGQTVMTFTGGASGDYLPLSGGTMSNTNLVTNMNADLLDGLHAASFMQSVNASSQPSSYFESVTQSGIYRLGSSDSDPNVENPVRNMAPYGNLLMLHGSGDTAAQILFPYKTSTAYLRCGNPFNSSASASWRAWREFAFKDDLSDYAKKTDTVASADKWATASNFTIKDADQTNSGTAVSVDGSSANGYTLLLPSKIKATTFTGNLTGNVTGNVSGSASKLAGTVTIWGNEFDGSQNVEGELTLGNGIVISCKNTSGTKCTAFGLSNQNRLAIGFGTAGAECQTRIYGSQLLLYYGTSRTFGMILNSDGNVGIGTSQPTKKLDVNGDIHTSGEIYLDNAKNIYVTNNPATGETAAALEVLRLTSGNNMYLCRGTGTGGYTTSLYGKGIILRYGDSGTAGITLNSAGNTTVSGHLKASTILSCHNAGATSGKGWVHVATITVTATGSQPLKFRVTQRLRVGGELTVLFSNASSVEETEVSEFFYTGDIVGANIITGGNGTFQLYIRKAAQADKIGISLVDVGEYVNGRMNVTWVDSYYGTTSPGGTVATCRYYFAHDVYMEYDSANEGVHVVNAGLYANTYVSSLGAGSTGTSGSTNLMYPLSAINDANLSTSPEANSVIMYKNNRWQYAQINSSGTLKTITVNTATGLCVGTSVNPTANSATITDAEIATFYLGFGGTVAENRVLASPNGSAGAPSWRKLTASDIPDLSSTYVTKANGVTAIVVGTGDNADKIGVTKNGIDTGFITVPFATNATTAAECSGNAATATKLKTKRELWGNDFDGSSAIGTSSTSASLSYVGSISMDSTITGCTGMTVTANARISQASNDLYLGKSDNSGWVYLADCCSQTSSTNWALRNDGDARFLYVGINGVDKNYRLYVNGSIKATANSYFTALELSGNSDTKIPYIDFHKGGMVTGRDYSSRIRESADGVLTICAQALSNGSYVSSRAGLVVGENNNGDYIKIGGATLTWVEGQGLKIDTGFWSESFVSSLGMGSGSSSGGGMTEDQMWTALATAAPTTSKINNSHINLNTLTIYARDNVYREYNGQTSKSLRIHDYFVTNDTEQEISGDKTFTGNLYTGGNVEFYRNAGEDPVFESWINSYFYEHVGTTGTVSVGSTTIPSTVGTPKFYVNGNSVLAGYVAINTAIDTNYRLKVSGKATVTGDFYAATDFMIRKVTNPDNSYYYTIGINQKTVSAQGTWQGTFTSGSDIRQKDVIRNLDILDISLEEIARTPIFEFTWNDKRDTKIHLGTSAQYWDSKLPSVVYGQMENDLSMDYGATALAAAVMTARVVLTHDEEIARLKRRIGELEQEIELLKAA